MKKTKRIFALLLALVMVLGLVSCGNKPANGDGEKVVIEYWHGQPDTMGGATIEDLVAQFNAQHDDIEVVTKYFSNQYTGILQGLQADAATGKAPGIIQLGWLYADYFMKNFQYTAPQDIIDAHFPEDKTFLTDNFDANILDLCKFNGERIGVPYSLSSSVMFYNVDLLKEAGLSGEAPKTWEEVEQFCRAVKEKTGKYGLHIEGYNWTYYTLMSSNGADVTIDKDGLSYANFGEGSEAAEAYNFFARLIKEGLALNTTPAEGNQSFKDGSIAMTFSTIAQMTSIQSSAQFNVASAMAPKFGTKDPVLHAGGCMLAITAMSEAEQKASWEFMKFLLSADNIARWTKDTGYVPARNDVADNQLKDYLAENQLMWAAMDQIPYMEAWPYYSGDAGLEGDVYMNDVRDRILGGEDAAKVLVEAQAHINKMVN